jgi:hypothetical protein
MTVFGALGLSVPVIDTGAGVYQITLKGEVNSNPIGSEYRLQISVKQGATELDRIMMHDFDSTSTLIVEEKTFCTSFIATLATESNIDFDIVNINNVATITKLKSSAIRLA